MSIADLSRRHNDVHFFLGEGRFFRLRVEGLKGSGFRL